MASESAGKHIRPPRRARRALGFVAAMLLASLALIAWLLGTESGARSAFSMLAALPNAPMRADGIHGRLAGPLRIERLSLDSATQLISMENIRLDWQPQALLNGQLHIRSLRIDKLDLAQKAQQKTEPARLPDNIALPFKLRADSVQVGGGDIRKGPVSLLTLGPFAFNLDFDGARYLLRVERFAARSGLAAGSVAGNFKGELTLSGSKPYPLRAQFSSGGEATLRDQRLAAAGRIDLDGSLAELGLNADLAVGNAKIQGRSLLRPFSDQLLGVTSLSAKAVDLSGFRPDLPGTALDVNLSVAENGTGRLTLSNRAAGLYNDKKAPLSDLHVDFRQHDGQVDFDSIAAALGTARRSAGSISGSGRYADGGLALELTAKALDLQRLDGRLQPTQLSGRLGLRQASGRQEFSVDLTEGLNAQKLALSAHALLADAALTVDRAELRLGDGRVALSGHADLANTQSFSASGEVARFRLKDIGRFAQLPDLFLNGRFALRGARQPQLVADLSFHIADSRLEGYPLQGEGNAQLRADGIDISRFLLAAGANRVSIEGRLAQGEGQLSFALTAPKLDQLGRGFGGALEAHGVARGSFERPRISASWTGSNIRIADQLQIDGTQGKADVQVDRAKPPFIDAASVDADARGVCHGAQQLGALSAQLQFAPQPNAPLRVAIRGQNVSAGGMHADSISATASGSTAQHVLDIALSEPQQSWTLNASGGLSRLDAAPQWQGSIQRFDAAGRFVAHLLERAPLFVSQQRVQLDRFRLDTAVAHIAVEQFLRDNSGIVTRGSIERLQVGQLLKFSAQEPALATDLQLSGDWNLRLADAPSGTLRIRRDSGDVVMRGSRPVALGLRNLEASANASNGQLALQLRADGQQLGVINANGTISLAGGSRFAPAADAPVSANIGIDIPSLGWAGSLVSPTTIVEGRLQSAVTVGGDLSQPRFGGKISGSGLRFLSADTGVDLRQGVLESEFQGSQLLLRSLRFPSRDGQLNASGRIDFADRQPNAQIVVKADRFTLLDRSDRRIRISGDSQLNWRDARASISGAFKVDSGFIDIGSTSMPRLSDDVVVVGRTQKKPAERGLPADIDVGVELGEGIALRGRGLDALLTGQLRFASAAGEALRARGTLQIAKGTFSAYGRELKIEQGVLRFNGPISNPSLDILAMRRGQQVEAGVAVLGTVLAPRVNLVSEPPVSDAEKLSWLVLGHGLDTTGQGELGALQNAAGALLSRGAAAGVQSQIASALGLDQLSVGSATQDGLQQRIVTLGKQINARLFVSLERGLETASSVLHLRYTLSPKLTLEADAGTRSALSVFYNFAFD